MGKVAVIAIGGNSLIRDENHKTVEDQYKAICETSKHIVGMVQAGYEVIDKDFASSLLAANINAELFIISTAVDKVYLNFNKSDELAIDKMTAVEAMEYIKQGHFTKGSMLPKIQAALKFIEGGGKRAIITNPESLELALKERQELILYYN